MRRLGKVLTVGVSLALISLPFVVWWKAQAITDWWALRGYEPPASIDALAEAGTMTPLAERIFFVNHPELIDDVVKFRQECPQNEHTIVLGCYHSGQRGIDIYNVQDERLDGVEEVTAAHEMLHAAYDRLNESEKDRVNLMLESYYKDHLKNKRIIETIGNYKDLQPTDIINEMHSIFATEVEVLPAPLEEYYRRYFEDRSAVVVFAQKYASEFSRRLNSIEDYDQRLAAIKTDIDSQRSSLARQLAALESDQRRLNALRSSGRTAEYNSGVADYNTKVNNYNFSISRLRSTIEHYNNLIKQRNDVASELRSLDSAIDTRLIPERVE